jgi:SAM-dependent methyltransferase
VREDREGPGVRETCEVRGDGTLRRLESRHMLFLPPSLRLDWLTWRVVRWVLVTACTAFVSRWVSNAVEAYPRVRKGGPAAACDPAAARDEQRLADTRAWRLAERWLAERALAPARARPTFERLRVLDVDFGPGGVAIALRQGAPLDATVVATDPYAGMGDLAQPRAARPNPRRQPQWVQAWGHGLPFRDDSFDVVVAAGALHGWPNPEPALAEIHRVLKPHGHYVVADFRRDVRMWVWLALRAAQGLFVPANLRSIDEPGASVRAAYAPHEAEWLAARARLPDIRVTAGPLWLALERRQR